MTTPRFTDVGSLPPDGMYEDPRMDVRNRQDEVIRSAHIDDALLASPLNDPESLADLNIELSQVNLERIYWPNYCRPTREANLNRLRTNWQIKAVGALYVSQHPDNYFAGIDGHHRWTVARELGIQFLPAVVLNGLSHEQEAALYNLYNRVSPHSALDRLQGRVEAKEEKALRLTSMIEEIGMMWDFKRTGAANTVNPVATVEYAFDTWGEQTLRDALHLLRDAWGTNRDAFRDDTIGGTVQFMARYGGYSFSVRDGFGKPVKFDRTRMLALMQERQLRIFRAEAMQISQMEHLRRSHSFGRAMRAIYNLHLRSGQLPTWPDRMYSEAAMQSHAEGTRRAFEGLSPEERSRRSRKSWATRRSKQEEPATEVVVAAVKAS